VLFYVLRKRDIIPEIKPILDKLEEVVFGLAIRSTNKHYN